MSWPVKKFSTLISPAGVFTDGDWVESKDQDQNGEVRLIQLADVGVNEFVDKSSRFMTHEAADRLRCTFLQPGDILIARMPDPIGRACIFPGDSKPCVTVVDVCIVRPCSDEIDSHWLVHLINSIKFQQQILKHVTGTTRQRISRGNLAQLEVEVPPLAEQKRIAAILDKADALRRKRLQAIDLADQFLRSVFLDMFGDPVTNPKGFDKVPLGDLIKVSSGNGLTAKDMAANGVHPVFGGNGINGYHDQYMFDKPKIVIGRVGAYCGVVHVTQPKSWVTDNALYVKESRTELQDSYLEHALKIANLNQYASQAGQPLISGSRIYPVEILLPPYGLQEKFQMLKRKSEKIHEELLRTKQVAENLFNSLSQKAFTGAL